MKQKTFILLTFSCVSICLLWLTTGIKDFKNEEGEEEGRDAYEALQFLSTAAAFPNIDIPPAAYGIARDFMNTHYSSASSRMQASSVWQSMGPNNVGGRTLSIALDPVDTNIIWLGSASGGLWKSVSGGYGNNAWQYIQTGFPVLGVGTIVINPQNKNVMYIGTGETYDYGTSQNGLVIRTTRGSNGIGILKSVDAGVTWTQALNWNYNQQSGVWDIIINPQNPNTVFAATTEGIYKSLNAGLTWTLSLNYTMVTDIEIDPSDTSVIYAGVGNLTSPTHGVYKTTNAGSTWAKLTNGLPAAANTGRISIDVYKNNANIVMAHICDDFSSVGLYRSVNKGQSWTQVSSDDMAGVQGWYAHGVMMKENDSSQVYICGQLLWASNSSGTNVFQATDYIPDSIETHPWPDMHDMISSPLDPDKIYLLTDAGLYRSNDFGLTWAWCADGYNVSQFYHGSVSATDSTIAIGGLQDRNTQLYNGTLNWSPYFNGDGTFTAINPTNDSIQYTSSQYLNIRQSLDRGQSFPFSIFNGNGAAFTAPYMLAPSNGDIMYAGDENINYSADGGQNWNSNGPVDNGNSMLSMDVSFTNENKLYFATAPSDFFSMHVFLSVDGGQTYGDISTGLPPDRYPRDIAVSPFNDNNAYIVFSGFGTGHIYKTTNSGNSWTDVSAPLPDIPFHTILCDPNNANTIYAGCDFGIFASQDAGATWLTFNAGLPEAVMVFDLEYSPADNSLVAFTHGHGVYKVDLDQLNLGMYQHAMPSNSFSIFYSGETSRLFATFTSLNSSALIFSVTDVQGKTIFTKPVSSKKGKNHFDIQLPASRGGIYFATLRADGKVNAKRFIIHH